MWYILCSKTSTLLLLPSTSLSPCKASSPNKPLQTFSMHTPLYRFPISWKIIIVIIDCKSKRDSSHSSRSTRVRINALTVSLSAQFVALSSASLALTLTLARPIINSSSQSVSRAVYPSDSLSVCLSV